MQRNKILQDCVIRETNSSFTGYIMGFKKFLQRLYHEKGYFMRQKFQQRLYHETKFPTRLYHETKVPSKVVT